ncbi:hypothetical protein Tco_1252416 [Tanacetum coccineum]
MYKVKREFSNSNLESRIILFASLPSIAPLRRHDIPSTLEPRHEEIPNFTCTNCMRWVLRLRYSVIIEYTSYLDCCGASLPWVIESSCSDIAINCRDSDQSQEEGAYLLFFVRIRVYDIEDISVTKSDVVEELSLTTRVLTLLNAPLWNYVQRIIRPFGWDQAQYTHGYANFLIHSDTIESRYSIKSVIMTTKLSIRNDPKLIEKATSKIIESYLLLKLPLVKYGLKPDHPFEFWEGCDEFEDNTRLESEVVLLATGYDGKSSHLRDAVQMRSGPGVGKTSLASRGRKFVRISLGGVKMTLILEGIGGLTLEACSRHHTIFISSVTHLLHSPNYSRPVVQYPNRQLPPVLEPLLQVKLQETSVHSSPAREEGEVPESELDPHTRRRVCNDRKASEISRCLLGDNFLLAHLGELVY